MKPLAARHHPRSLAGARLPVRQHDPGRARRHRDQDRGAGPRRRDPRLRAVRRSATAPAESAYYFAFNRGKQSVTVNLRSKEGQEIIRELARGADVLLENFPVGTLARYGLDYPAIRAVNERIVYVSCTGFGQTGPHAHRRGYDTIFQAMGGIMSLTGERGGPPVKPGLPVADLTSGLWAAIAVLAALRGAPTADAAATSTSRCSTARSPCSRSRPRAGSRSARCRRGSAPSTPAACPRRASAAPTAISFTSPRATSIGCRSAGCSGSRPGAAKRSCKATARACAGATR